MVPQRDQCLFSSSDSESDHDDPSDELQVKESSPVRATHPSSQVNRSTEISSLLSPFRGPLFIHEPHPVPASLAAHRAADEPLVASIAPVCRYASFVSSSTDPAACTGSHKVSEFELDGRLCHTASVAESQSSVELELC